MFVMAPADRDNNRADAITTALFFYRKDHEFKSMLLEAWRTSTGKELPLVPRAVDRPSVVSDCLQTYQCFLPSGFEQ